MRWVALDDMDMTAQLGSHMVLTDPDCGMNYRDAKLAISILNNIPLESSSDSDGSVGD